MPRKALGPIDVGDGQRDDLELHVDAESARRPASLFAAYVGSDHVDLRRLLSAAASPAASRFAPVDSLVRTLGAGDPL
jgi:hypothetical protein